jgi:2-oxoglutarate ferredoxin oxidoreductase subunit beta
MSTTPVRINRSGFELTAYKGSRTTLCAGCGHNAISERVIDAFFELGVDPYRVAKFSGIGCSSKTPAYFLQAAHGFNGVHGRMPALATGAVLANRDLLAIGVSGDGDTASIGIGQFVHLMRRNLPIIYIIENNGVYGLTKGQFSATADIGSTLKTGIVNDIPPIDCCALAIQLGASFVARSFSGDKRQLFTLLKAATAHRGTVLLDIISPCVAFNDHEGSTKSYAYMKEHEEPVQGLDFIPAYEDITVDYEPGQTVEVKMHDGSRVILKKLGTDYDATDRAGALQALAAAERKSEVLTGLLYLNTAQKDFVSLLNMVDEPLATLGEDRTRPPQAALTEIMEELR